MSNRSVILIGGPDSGKTNFLGRLWLSLRSGGGAITAAGNPEDIKYVEDIVAHLHQGSFAPRTDKNLEPGRGDFTIPLNVEGQQAAELVIPDVSGEIWKKAVANTELAPEWMETLENAVGALLFVRVLSPLNVSPLDWVTSAELMSYQNEEDQNDTELPTQVVLCELLRFLEVKLAANSIEQKPRVSVIVTAWDLLDEERSKAGPYAYLEKMYPLFAGRIADIERLDVEVFGMSVLGGDPEANPDFKDDLLDSNFKTVGYVRYDTGGDSASSGDFTLPVAWAIGSLAAF